MPLKYRVLTIVALCLVSIWALFPRKGNIRYRGTDGLLHADTSRRIPLREGLDLKGGVYLRTFYMLWLSRSRRTETLSI